MGRYHENSEVENHYQDMVSETSLIPSREAKSDNERKPFELTDESLVKLGLKEEKKESSLDTLKKATEQDKDKKSEIKVEDPEQGKSKDIKKTDEKQDDKKESLEKKEDNKTSDNEQEKKELSFFEKVQARLQEEIKDLDEEDQEYFWNDLEKGLNDRKGFVASVTRKSMDVSEQRRKVEALIEKINSDKVQEAIKTVSQLEDYDDVMGTIDDWYDGKENNQIRKLVNLLQDVSPSIEKHSKDELAAIERQRDLDFREEILNLYELDPSYKKDLEKLKQVAKIADEMKPDLSTAHRILKSEAMESELRDKSKEVKTLKDEVKKLKEELAKRNEQLEKKLSSESINTPPMGVLGKGVKEEDYAEPSSGFDETERRLYKKFGI